jgi:uncharacterized membrane protein YgcG
MTTPHFRFGGYMQATGGGTDSAASSSYGTPTPPAAGNTSSTSTYTPAQSNVSIPNEPSAENYGGVFDAYDTNQPMGFGFGSVFGSSSGTTGSSQTVQDVLTYMMESEYNKPGTTPEDAAINAYYNFYGGDVVGDDGMIYGSMGNTGNRSIAQDFIDRKYDQMYSGFGGGGGGFNYGYGRGGGGDGGGGFGYNMNMGMIGQPKQRGQVGPGSLQEQVNQAFLSGGKPFAKGGIVSLVED